MGAALNLQGARFNMLVGIRREGKDKHGKALWRFACDCGKETVIIGSAAVSGKTGSCGCQEHSMSAANARAGRDKIAASKTRHGGCGTAVYAVWKTMRQRCLNPRSPDYASYGGAGITVSDRWSTFEAFIADMGPRPSPGHSIDRIDNSRGYEPGNCRWATAHEQRMNQRRMRHGDFAIVA